MPALYQYAFAAGWNVALASLQNPEHRSEFYIAGRNQPPHSTPLNTYPIRRVVLSGAERGDGRLDHVWEWDILPRSAVAYIITLFSLSSAASAAATIYTRLHETDTYARYNCYVCRFVPEDDYRYRQGKYVDVRLRFRGLTPSS